MPSSLVDGVLYVSSGASVEALDALTGDLLWRYEPGATFGFVFSSPDVVDGVVYVGLFDGYLHAVDASKGAPLWHYKIPGSNGPVFFHSPKVVDGVVYVSSFDNYLNALSASTGEMLWRSAALESEDSAAYSLTVVDGVIYLGSISGHLYALDAPPVE